MTKKDLIEVVAKKSNLTHKAARDSVPVSYTHLRAHETVLDLVCRLLLEKKKSTRQQTDSHLI